MGQRWQSLCLAGVIAAGIFRRLVLIIIFGVELGWLPVMGKGESWWDWRHLLMLAFSLPGLVPSGAMVRSRRSSMLEVLGSETSSSFGLKACPSGW